MSQEIIVHNGRHHTDDALVYVLLRTLFPDHQLIRTRDPEVLQAHPNAIIADVGMVHDAAANRFDHHQQDRTTRKITIEGVEHEVPYSASSLIWDRFGDAYLQKVLPGKSAGERAMVHRLVETQCLAWHDAHDNRAPEEMVKELAEREEAKAPIFGRAFFKKIELFRPLYLELPRPDRLDLQGTHRAADQEALAMEDAGFRQSADILQPLFEEIVHSAAAKADAFLDGQEATPARVNAFEKQVAAGTAQIDLQPVIASLEQTTNDRQQRVWASSMRDAQGHPREALVDEHDSIRPLDELAKDPAWAATFAGLKLDPSVLKQIGFSHQDYYAPLYDLPSARVHGSDDKMAIIIAPSTEGGFSLIPQDPRSGLRFPAAWGGLEKEELRQKIGGGLSANFVHNSGFIASASDFRSALLMSVQAVEIGERGTEASAEVKELLHHNPNTSQTAAQPLPSAGQFTDPRFDIEAQSQILAERAAERQRKQEEEERIKQEQAAEKKRVHDERVAAIEAKRQERAERQAAKEAEKAAKAKPAPLPSTRNTSLPTAGETLRPGSIDFNSSRASAKTASQKKEKEKRSPLFYYDNFDNFLPA